MRSRRVKWVMGWVVLGLVFGGPTVYAGTQIVQLYGWLTSLLVLGIAVLAVTITAYAIIWILDFPFELKKG